MKNLFLFRGISGSGKSTLANSIGTTNVEADTYFVNKDGEYNFDARKLSEAHKWCQDYTNYLMEKETINISVSNTFTQEWEMKPYFNLAKKHGYKVFTMVVENRHGGQNQHNVPQDAIDRMVDRFEIKLI